MDDYSPSNQKGRASLDVIMKEIATIRSAALEPLIAGYINQCQFTEKVLITCGLRAEAVDDPGSELPQICRLETDRAFGSLGR